MVTKYEKANIEKQIKEKCKHLNSKQQKVLIALLKNYERLFDRTSGMWKNSKCKIELKEGASPTMAVHTIYQEHTKRPFD